MLCQINVLQQYFVVVLVFTLYLQNGICVYFFFLIWTELGHLSIKRVSSGLRNDHKNLSVDNMCLKASQTNRKFFEIFKISAYSHIGVIYFFLETRQVGFTGFSSDAFIKVNRRKTCNARLFSP